MEIGFASTGSFLFKTTNSGLNWNQISGQNGFNDIFLVDSLTGWKFYDSTRKTTDGGITWIQQQIVNPNFFSMYGVILSASNIGRDTIWGVGLRIEYPNLQIRSIIHRTTNGGMNWCFQIPDTSFKLPLLIKSNFKSNLIGWVYAYNRGVHTVTGGDSTFYPITELKQLSNNIPASFLIYQNYPNPFNPKTVISYELRTGSNIIIKVYDALGKELRTLVNKKHNAGTYKVNFDGSGLPSGVYFYSLFVEGEIIDTKKMMLLR